MLCFLIVYGDYQAEILEFALGCLEQGELSGEGFILHCLFSIILPLVPLHPGECFLDVGGNGFGIMVDEYQSLVFTGRKEKCSQIFTRLEAGGGIPEQFLLLGGHGVAIEYCRLLFC